MLFLRQRAGASKEADCGPGVYICDECIELCNEIIEEEFNEDVDVELSNIPRPRR